jgi:hypothetical protein
MRWLLKFCHHLSSCGMAAGLIGYAFLLLKAPQETSAQVAELRMMVSQLANYVLVPSLGLALVSGLLAIVVHRPFQENRWVWVKALIGLTLFESTLAIVQSKANDGALIAAQLADGKGAREDLQVIVASEWTALYAITALVIASIALGTWRPALRFAAAKSQVQAPAS